jgi:adenosine deaminase
MAPPLTVDDARRVPKVELHLHVESLTSAARVEALADALGVPLLKPRGELYRCGSLAELLEACAWWCDLFRTPEIAEGIAYGAAARLHDDGVVYAEVAVGPRYWPHVPFPALLPALCAGFDRAQRDGLADCRLLPTISRDQPAGWALELVDWIAAAGLPRIAGIGLDGDEAATGRTGPLFAPAFERARAHGLGTTAHAGESSGPEGVRDALYVLGVRRVDHGVRAIEDPALVERLARDGVTLKVCPTPNVALGLYPGLDDHPLAALIAAGVPVTLGSDDACVYGITLAGELDAMGGRLGWTLADVERITRQAIAAAFCDEARKAELRALVEGGYSSSP